MSEIIFWETGGISSKKILKDGHHVSVPIVWFGINGQIKGTDKRHDVSIGNKWSYMTEQEKLDWKEAAKKKITETLI